MILNPDCVRDTMICLANLLKIENGNHFITASAINVARELIVVDKKDYTLDDITYTILQLVESNYLKAEINIDYKVNTFYISPILYITPAGHDFLSAVENNQSWTKTKTVLKSIGCVSLSIINSIAQGFAQGLAQDLATKLLPTANL